MTMRVAMQTETLTLPHFMQTVGRVWALGWVAVVLLAGNDARADEPTPSEPTTPDAPTAPEEPVASPTPTTEPTPTEPTPTTEPIPTEPEPTPEPTPAPVPESPKVTAPAVIKPVRHPALGYRAYEGSFYDIRYGRELAPWASPDGKTSITLGGLRMFENRGLTINVVMLVLSMGGAAGRPMTRVTTDWAGNQYVDAAAEARAHEEYNQKLIAGAATQPFSLDLRGYHDSLGSEMNGFSMALLISSSASEEGVKQFGLEGGYLETNRNYVPAAGAEMEFTRGWLGLTYDHRRRLYQHDRFVLGLHGHVLLALADPWMALVTIGPELAITDRLHLAAFASQDLHRFDLSNGTGWRAELGVRF